jgi:hypothetical protein
MSKIGEIWRRLEMFARREEFGRDLEEEMRLHRVMKERELIAGGADSEEARYAAARAFGNATSLQEGGREAWGWRWLEDVAEEFGVRGHGDFDAGAGDWCEYGDFQRRKYRATAAASVPRSRPAGVGG